MANTKITLTRELGGVEDLLLDANAPATVVQERLVGETVENVTVHKINWETIPVAGKLGDSNFKSLKDLLDYMNANKMKKCSLDSSGKGICLVVGDGGDDTIWDGGAPSANEIALAQVGSNGHLRWIGKGTVGSDDFHFRGKVSGEAGTDANDFTTKGQLDELRRYVDEVKNIANTQSDWNVSNTSSPAYIKNKPSIPHIEYATTSKAGIVKGGTRSMLDSGTDTTYRAWTAKDLKAFSEASSGSGYGAGKIAPNPTWSSVTHPTKRLPLKFAIMNHKSANEDETGVYLSGDCKGATTDTYTFVHFVDFNGKIQFKVIESMHSFCRVRVVVNGSTKHSDNEFYKGESFTVNVRKGDMLGAYFFVPTPVPNGVTYCSAIEVKKV